jgi:hypothetical protein
MRGSKLQSKDTSTLIADLAEWSARHGQFTNAGDYRATNKCAKRVIAIKEELTRRGPNVFEGLVGLLDHSDTWVRLSAGAYLASHGVEAGVERLRELVKVPGFVGFEAGWILRRLGKWDVGGPKGEA